MLELIGMQAEGMQRLKSTLDKIDPQRKFIKFYGAMPYEKLNEFYGGADIGLFASSCENMPNILVENMAAGLPIACSGNATFSASISLAAVLLASGPLP